MIKLGGYDEVGLVGISVISDFSCYHSSHFPNCFIEMRVL